MLNIALLELLTKKFTSFCQTNSQNSHCMRDKFKNEKNHSVISIYSGDRQMPYCAIDLCLILSHEWNHKWDTVWWRSKCIVPYLFGIDMINGAQLRTITIKLKRNRLAGITNVWYCTLGYCHVLFTPITLAMLVLAPFVNHIISNVPLNIVCALGGDDVCAIFVEIIVSKAISRVTITILIALAHIFSHKLYSID